MKMTELLKVDSTNDYLLKNYKDFSDGTGVFTLEQHKGKGTRGRQWLGEKGENLAMSIVHRLPASNLGGVSLVCGIAVVDALEDSFGITAKLKWSNDVIVEGKKICGILCESKIQQGEAVVVMGIGINILGDQEGYLRKGIPHAVSLEMIGATEVEVASLWSGVQNRLNTLIEIYKKDGFSQELRDMYRKRSITLGKNILIVKGDSTAAAEALDINEDGSLVCRIEGEIVSLYSGDVSVRGIMGYAE